MLAGGTGCAAVAGLGSADGPLNGSPSGNSWGIVNLFSEVSAPYPYGVGIDLCVERAGTVELRSVEPARVGGPLLVDRVGVRSFSDGDGGAGLQPGREMPATYLPVDGYLVTNRCTRPQRNEVAVQIRRTGAGDAAVRGLRVSYLHDGRSYTETWPVTLILCDPERPRLPMCRDG